MDRPEFSGPAAIAAAEPASPAPEIAPRLREPRKQVRAKILRPSFQPLKLARRIPALLAEGPRADAAAWVLGAAEGQLLHAGRLGAPERWLAELQAAVKPAAAARRQRAACRAWFEAHLPDDAWREDALLGETLLAARALQSGAPVREGRAGRVSEPNVYTPAPLARRIVGGAMLGPCKVVDPACGAGVFLVAAFERAFDRRTENGQPTLEAARAVLTHELCGVDIDAEALAVARFNLRFAGWLAAGLQEDVPLDLRRADALSALDGLECHADLVVGNPPYVEGRGLSAERLGELRARFRCAAGGKINLFAVFVERGLELLRPGGTLSFVLPATFQRNERYRALRELLLQHTIESIVPAGDGAFEGRVVEAVILRVRKQPPARSARVELPGGARLQRAMPLGPELRFGDAHPPAVRLQIEAMDRLGRPLGELFDVRDGISTGFQPFPKRLIGRVEGHAFEADDGTRAVFDPRKHMRIIDGAEFSAYSPVRWEGRWIEYDKTHEHVPPHPGKPFNCQLRERAIFDREAKLLTRQTARGLIATVDRERYFVRNSVHATYPKPGACELSLEALCACLNASFYDRYFLAVTGENGKVFPQVHIADLKRLPLLAALLAPAGALDGLGRELLRLHQPGQGAAEEIAACKARVDLVLEQAFGL